MMHALLDATVAERELQREFRQYLEIRVPAGFYELRFGLVDRQNNPVIERFGKEMATRFVPDRIQKVVHHLGRAPELTPDDSWESFPARVVLASPSGSIRGGASEIFGAIVTKGPVG